MDYLPGFNYRIHYLRSYHYVDYKRTTEGVRNLTVDWREKGKLIGQLLVEVLCVAVLAFSLSIFTGGTVSQKMGDSLLQKEITAEEQENNPRDQTFMFGMNDDQGQEVDPIDNIDVSVTSQDVLKVGGLGLLIAILSTIIPALSILRLKPKEILLKD